WQPHDQGHYEADRAQRPVRRDGNGPYGKRADRARAVRGHRPYRFRPELERTSPGRRIPPPERRASHGELRGGPGRVRAMRILAISGSLRAGSYNSGLARAASDLAPEGVEVELYRGLERIPPYHQDLDQEGIEMPEAVRELRRQIEDADASLFAPPSHKGLSL